LLFFGFLGQTCFSLMSLVKNAFNEADLITNNLKIL